MKTVLTELIEKLNKEINFITDTDSYGDRMHRSGLREAMTLATFLLEKEKQQIIDAWENGYEHGACVNEDKDKYHGNQYYKERFNGK